MAIDVHAHFFNARYIPIAGIGIKNRKIPPALARLVAAGIIAATPDDDSLEEPEFERDRVVEKGVNEPDSTVEPGPEELSSSEAIDRFVRTLPAGLLTSPAFDAVVAEASPVGAFTTIPSLPALPPPTSAEGRRAWLSSYLHTPATHLLKAPADAEPGVGGYLSFLYHFTCRETKLLKVHQAQSPGVGLFVHCMMDMEWPYEDEPEYAYDRAVRRVKQLALQSGGRVLAFVAFDAYRPNSLEIVERALRDGTAVGVKVYPPSGYRFDDNGDAIRARTGIPVGELNARCAGLLELCEKGDFPIMAHCSPHGMEVSRDPYSGFNANPAFWAKVLGEKPRLRLCLSHAGGPGHWFKATGYPPDSLPDDYPWAPSVIDLCRRHPNVFMDLSHFGGILNDEAAADFIRVLSADLTSQTDTPHALSDKIMYGTDYPMPLPDRGWARYHRAMVRAFEDDRLSCYRDAFFQHNATRFLNLNAYLARVGTTLPPEHARYLRTYCHTG